MGATTHSEQAPATQWPDVLRVVAVDVKIAHSVFALPFAVLAAFLAAARGGTIDGPRFAIALALVIVAMVLARTAAMLANRILDRRIDAANPRTAGRAIPSGRLSLRAVAVVLAAACAGFVLVAVAFGALLGNWWPALLALPVLAWICAYPLLKRVTSLCHLWLGASLALSPLAAALAVEPAALGDAAPWWLAAAVLGWVAGFDVIYALQDEAVDRDQGIHSLPGRLGGARALWISRLLHATAAGALVMTAQTSPRLGAIFTGAVAVVIALLVIEQATVARWGTRRIALAFFTLNGAISVLVGLAGVTDVILSV